MSDCLDVKKIAAHHFLNIVRDKAGVPSQREIGDENLWPGSLFGDVAALLRMDCKCAAKYESQHKSCFYQERFFYHNAPIADKSFVSETGSHIHAANVKPYVVFLASLFHRLSGGPKAGAFAPLLKDMFTERHPLSCQLRYLHFFAYFYRGTQQLWLILM